MVVEALLSYPTQPQQELQQVALVALASSSQVELVAHQLLLTQVAQAAAVVDLSLLVATLQVTLAVLVETAEAVAEVLTTLEHLALAVTA